MLPKIRVISENASNGSPPPLVELWIFCTKVNAQQLLFEPFPHIMRIFGGVVPQTEFTFPFQYNTYNI